MSETFSRFSPQNPFNSPNHRPPFMIDMESIKQSPEKAFALDVSSHMDHSLRCVNMGNATARALKLSVSTGESVVARHPWIHQHRPSCPDHKGL